MKVLFYTENMSPYRIDFFNEVNKYCELTVAYEKETTSDRNIKWWEDSNIKFSTIKLNTIHVLKDKVISKELIKLIRKETFDIIVIGGYSTYTGMLTIQYLKNKKIPFIINCDGGIIKNDKKLKYKIKKHFIGSASEWLGTGMYTNKYLEYYGADLKNTYTYHFTSLRSQDIIENTIAKEEKESLRKKLNLNEENIVIGVGSLIPRKGFDVLIKASKELKTSDVGIYIIGSEPDDEYIRLKEEEKADNVHFVGFKKKEELQEYYKAADVFVLPTREDIWGLVINEAMAGGLPVITTDNCIAGKELIVDGENGYIVPVDNILELAKCMDKIIGNAELKINMSQNNIKKIKEYTIENMAKEHKEIFDEILKKRN